MNSKLLEFLLKEIVNEVSKEGDIGRLETLVKSNNGKIEAVLKEHRPVVKARLDRARADLMAKVAEVDMILEEIKGD